MSEQTKRIRAARAYAGLSQPAMAEAIEVSEATYKRIELGERPARPMELREIAATCELPLEWFAVDFSRLPELADGSVTVKLVELQEAFNSLTSEVRAIAQGRRPSSRK